MDLSDWEASCSVVERCLPIDLLVNNVGAGSNQPFIEVSESQIDLMMNVNFKSMVSVTQVTSQLVHRALTLPGIVITKLRV